MKSRISLLVLMIVLLISCSVDREEPGEIDLLGLSQDITVRSEMTLSQIADNISYTKLESKSGCFIERITQYSISKNYILVFDKNQSQILLFGRNGKFLRPISKIGKGPGEFFYPKDVRIARNEKFVLIHFSNRVLRYGFDGRFLGETTLTQGADVVDSFDDGLVAFYRSFKAVTMDSYSIVFYDWHGNITGQLAKRNWDRLERGFPVRRSMFYYLNNELRYHEHYYDTVYAVTNDREVKPRISIIRNYNFDRFRQPYNSMEIMDFILDVWMEMPDYIFVNGSYKNMMHPMYLDKKTEKIYHIPFNKKLKTYGLPNDLDGGAPFWPSRYQDGKVISIQYAPGFKTVLDNKLIDNAEFKDQKLRESLISFKENLTEEDGPVLIEISLK